MDFDFMWETLLRLLSGVPLTLNLAFTSVAFGAVLAHDTGAHAHVAASGCSRRSREPTCSCSAARRCWCRSS